MRRNESSGSKPNSSNDADKYPTGVVGKKISAILKESGKRKRK